jgi:pimeloyl-ACP methyl ester carboxylesterase
MPSINRQGATISYEDSGSGPPILMGHSLLCDGRMWADVLPPLAATHRIINIDARGHRHSTAPGPFTLEDLAGDWLAILDHEQIDRAVLCGLSMGGMTAMRLALRAPERVSALVLCDTSADPEPTYNRIKYSAMAEIVRRVGYLAPIMKTAASKLFGRTTRRTRPDLVARELDRIREKDRAQLYHALHAVFDRPSIAHRIAAITCPALVVVGDEDVSTTPDRSRRIAEAISGATLVTLPEVGHLSALEAPERLSHEIERWLERVSGQKRQASGM